MSSENDQNNPIPAENYYGFGQKSVAMLGLLLTSNGAATVLAYHRPTADLTQPLPTMAELYRSNSLQLKTGTVPFVLSLADKKDGLLTVEPLGWTRPYEGNRTHFLGLLNPFGADELPYQKLGASRRSGDIPANRKFAGVFTMNPGAADPLQRAVLTLTDVDSAGQGVETINLSAFDDPASGLVGSVFVAIRVNTANYGDACATLEFTGGHQVTIASKTYATVTLNTTATP